MAGPKILLVATSDTGGHYDEGVKNGICPIVILHLQCCTDLTIVLTVTCVGQ